MADGSYAVRAGNSVLLRRLDLLSLASFFCQKHSNGWYMRLYTPKLVQLNFTWGRNDVRMAIEHAYWSFFISPKTYISPNKFLATPLSLSSPPNLRIRSVDRHPTSPHVRRWPVLIQEPRFCRETARSRANFDMLSQWGTSYRNLHGFVRFAGNSTALVISHNLLPRHLCIQPDIGIVYMHT